MNHRFPLAVLAALAAALVPLPERLRAGDHWAFRPVRLPAVPAVRDQTWVRTPIDAFLLARLEAEGRKPAAPADKRTLLRRVTFDLTGLPPTLEEQKAFLEDSSPQSYDKVVDGLLARPEYGERWARHWLDVARFAETNGYERDGAKPGAYHYRDYVIDAFNKDKPYDRFVTEQLAGDELPDADAETQTATTFLRLGTWDDEPANAVVDRYDQLDDVLGTTATAFLGITLRCARCHDHKFEPFTQTDYYRMLAVFEPLKRPQIERKELDRLVGSAAEIKAYEEALSKWEEDATGTVPRPKELSRAYIWYEDGPKAPVTRVFKRGDPHKAGAEVGPGLPAVLVKEQPPPPTATAQSTGRRLWLARWVAAADNPLTARVMVNRVWQHHFGKGLVATPNDFGVMGDPPSHPELLDYLTARFVADGWSLKKLHRLIVLSGAYQTSSVLEGGDEREDKRLALFGRWRQRRLEAEALRDAVLAVSGQLNPERGGPGVYPPLPRAVLEGQSRPGEGWGKSNAREAARRSVYVFCKRSLRPPELDLLDAPDTTSSCEQRPVSTTAPQALTFLNGAFLNEQAGCFALRLQHEAGTEPAAQVRRAFELALCRPPRADEVDRVVAFMTKQQNQIRKDAEAAGKPATEADAGLRALTAFCLVLLNTNEFAYPG